MTYIINLGQQQLAIRFGRKPGRPKKSLPARLEKSIVYLVKLAKDKRRAGQPLSRVFRLIFENKKTRQIFGLNLTLIALFAGIIVPPISAFSGNLQTETTTINPVIIRLTTKSSIRLPTDSFNLSQGYSLSHRGIDLDSKAGEPVYPIMDGVVEEIAYNRFAYGNHIIINHGSGFKSLYAHLSKIIVVQDEEVDKTTVLGTVGSTGWATGPHLHLEVYDNGQPFNPLTILK